MDFSCRKMNKSDIDQVASLFDQYRVFYQKSSDVVGAIQFLTDRYDGGESIVFICETTEGKVIGFTQLYPLFSSTRMKKLWLLNDLFVDPSFRGNGVSKLLIDAAKDLCRESLSAGMMLETDKGNIIGNVLYPATGFDLDQDHNFYSWDV